jgi:phosphoglycolate phosphatase
LINTGGAGVQALKLAGRRALDLEDAVRGIDIAGRTDTAIVRQILMRHGAQSTDEEVRKFLDSYLDFLVQQLPACAGRILPGVTDLFVQLQLRPHLTLGLLTGNLARGAQLKLDHYGLWKYFRFGAFADDHHDRDELGIVACARALKHTGRQFPPSHVDVIGDTGHDIACGKAIGARTIAVASGSWPREKLAEHEPDFLFTDLSRTDDVIATLGW